MLNEDGVEVVLRWPGSGTYKLGVTDATPLTEYVDRTQEKEKNHMRCYVESVAGKRFELGLILHPKFNRKKHQKTDAFDFTFSIDGGPDRSSTHMIGSINRPREHYCQKDFVFWEDGKWRKGGLTFGKTQIEPYTSLHPSKEEHRASELRGRIDVTVTQGKAYAVHLEPGATPMGRINSKPEVKGSTGLVYRRGVGHSIVADDPKDFIYKGYQQGSVGGLPREVRLQPTGGCSEEWKFTFFYRTKMWLNMNGYGLEETESRPQRPKLLLPGVLFNVSSQRRKRKSPEPAEEGVKGPMKRVKGTEEGKKEEHAHRLYSTPYIRWRKERKYYLTEEEE